MITQHTEWTDLLTAGHCNSITAQLSHCNKNVRDLANSLILHSLECWIVSLNLYPTYHQTLSSKKHITGLFAKLQSLLNGYNKHQASYFTFVTSGKQNKILVGRSLLGIIMAFCSHLARNLGNVMQQKTSVGWQTILG